MSIYQILYFAGEIIGAILLLFCILDQRKMQKEFEKLLNAKERIYRTVGDLDFTSERRHKRQIETDNGLCRRIFQLEQIVAAQIPSKKPAKKKPTKKKK